MNGEYSFDECAKKDKDFILEKLENLEDQGLIEFNMIDKWSFEIQDINLDDDTIIELKELFHEKNVIEVTDINGDDMEWDEEWD